MSGLSPAATGPEASQTTVAERLFRDPCHFDFFRAVQLLELMNEQETSSGDGAPSNGRRRFRVRFSAHLSTAFPASTIYDIRRGIENGPPRMSVSFFGLTGPSGVLPRHYSELLLRLDRDVRGPGKHALRDWLDLFNDRFIWLFYRAWEKYRFPAAYSRREHQQDSPDDFTHALYSLIGLGTPSLHRRPRSRTNRESMPATAQAGSSDAVARREAVSAASPHGFDRLKLLRYAGLLAQQRRSASNLQRLLADYFQVPVQVQQFQGQWLSLDASQHTRLGRAGGANQRLGQETVAGCRVWDLQSKIRITLGPLDYRTFECFLPESAAATEKGSLLLLGRLTRLFVGPALDYDVRLILQANEVPSTRLSSETSHASRLGWNSWLASAARNEDAADATLAVPADRSL